MGRLTDSRKRPTHPAALPQISAQMLAVGQVAAGDTTVGSRPRGGVHLLRQRVEADAAPLQVRDDPDEMGEGAAQPVQLPNDQHIAGAEICQTRLQAQPIVACAGRAILMQMAVIDTGEEECITLQVNGLALISGRDPHVTDQHVRQTPRRPLSHTGPIRQGLSRRKAAAWRATFRTQPMITGINCLPSPKTR